MKFGLFTKTRLLGHTSRKYKREVKTYTLETKYLLSLGSNGTMSSLMSHAVPSIFRCRPLIADMSF